MNICIDIHYDDEIQGSDMPSLTSSTSFGEKNESSSTVSQKKKIRPKKRYLKENQYNWNETQNRRYINFLSKQGHLLRLSTQEKKKMKVNVQMSKCIQTRNSTQCHTHHQKMIEKYCSIEGIIAEYSYLVKDSKRNEGKMDSAMEMIQTVKSEILEVEDEQIYPSSIWKQYIMPDIFVNEEFEFDYLYQL